MCNTQLGVRAEIHAATRLIERTVPVTAPGGNVAPGSAPIVPNAAAPASSGRSVAASLADACCWAVAASSTGCCCSWLDWEASAGICAGAGGGGCALQVTLPSLPRARCTAPPTRSPRACASVSGETVTSRSTLFAITPLQTGSVDEIATCMVHTSAVHSIHSLPDGKVSMIQHVRQSCHAL